MLGGGGRLVDLVEVADGAKTEEVLGWVDMLFAEQGEEMLDFCRIFW